jgi:hypothetical protein
MGAKGIPLYGFSFLWDAEVGAIDRHEAVIAHAVIETALEVDLRVGWGGWQRCKATTVAATTAADEVDAVATAVKVKQ